MYRSCIDWRGEVKMKEKIFKCHKISEGCIEGEVIISKDDVMFYLIKTKKNG